MKRALVLLIACCASMVLLAQQPHWTPVDEGLYSGSTGIIAVVQIGGVEQSSTQIELAAFCGEECRGTAFTTEFPITNRFLALLNVYGENGHELTFKAYNHSTNQELIDMNPVVTVVFSEDGSGSLFEPLELNFNQEVVSENIIFADQNVKNLCVANWDTNGDGELSYAEAAAVTDLGAVFRGNRNITSFDELQYFTGLTAINNYSFKDCLELITVTIPNTVTSIRHMAFCSCRKLASFTIPNTVISIGSLAFEDVCLTSISIPASVTSIGEEAFGSCSSLAQIVVEPNNTVYDSRDNCNAIIKTSNNKLISGCKNTIIPNTVTSIGNYAFYGCDSLTSITIPSLVDSVGRGVFGRCSSLTQISVVPDNTVYDSRDNCNAIIKTSNNILISGCKNTIIPNSVITIGTYAFYNCDGLTSITIPASVTSIKSKAFLSCTNLASMSVLSLAPPTIEDGAFTNVNKAIPVSILCGSLSVYQNASGWSDFTNYHELECPSYEITATANPTNGGTITGSGTFTQGTTCTLTAMPNTGYTFVNWTKDGEEISTESTYSFTVTEDASFVANFETGFVTQTTNLSRGWNWYSTYIEQEDINGLGQLENSIGVPNAIIQSQYDGYVKSGLRNGRVVWKGALTSINNEEMYKIGTKRVRTTTMEGQITDPANHPITIYKGWNWIGFPCSQSVSVNEALSGFTPKNGDAIKGIHSYATYSNGTWSGTLNTLEPGQGYMYGSKDRRPKTLVYQSGRGEATLANITPENNFYQPVDDYADNMTLTAVIELDGEELRSEDYELAAFVDDECRGSVKLMYVEPINRYVAFLTVFGDETEDLYFVLTDGTDMSQSEDFVRYETDGMVGSLGEPVTLRFGTTDVNENASVNVRVYPNPSEGIFNVEGNGIRRIEVANVYGQVILSKDVEDYSSQIDMGNNAAGIYMLRVVTDDGIATRQIVKK